MRYLFSLLLFVFVTPAYAESQNNKILSKPQKSEMKTLELTLNQHSFVIQLSDNPTAQAFAQLLPLDLTMQDHLNNEKYATLPNKLPRQDVAVGKIEAGDVMLYQGDTLVIFYESFATPYRYTRIGKINIPKNFAELLGQGDVRVSLK